MNKREAERSRRRMKLIVERMQEYVRTYTDQAHYQEYTDGIFIEDMLYGIGLALDPESYRGSDGYEAFTVMLRQRLNGKQRAVQPSGEQ